MSAEPIITIALAGDDDLQRRYINRLIYGMDDSMVRTKNDSMFLHTDRGRFKIAFVKRKPNATPPNWVLYLASSVRELRSQNVRPNMTMCMNHTTHVHSEMDYDRTHTNISIEQNQFLRSPLIHIATALCVAAK